MDLAHEPPFRLGGLSVRPSTREVEHAGGRETLEPRVMEVLVVLAKAGSEVVSRDDLIAACWDGRIVSEDAINRVISRIRRLATATGERDFKLETITKVGYRLVAAPKASPAAPPQAAAPAAPRASLFGGRLDARAASLAAMTLAAVVLAGLLALRFAPREEAAAAPPTALTLAVLPFDNLSGASEIGYVADGLSRELRNSLSRVRGLRVISDSSSFAAAAEPLGAVEIGDRLGADLLLDGSVREAEGALRVTLELVDAETGSQAWTAAHTVSQDDLGAGERLLTVAVIEELVARLGPDRIEAFAPPRRSDPISYRLVMQARLAANEAATFRQRADFDGFRVKLAEAQRLARLAVETDPQNPDALVLLARMTVGWIGSAPLDEDMTERPPRWRLDEEALDLFGRALAVDPDNPAALTSLGERLRGAEWRWRDAEAMLRRALAIDPNYTDAHTAAAYLMAHMGRCLEGLEHARAAAALDPIFNWRSFAEPRLLKCAGRREEAERLYLEILARDRAQVFLAAELHINHMSDGDSGKLRAVAAHIRDELWAGETMTDGMAAVVARMEAGADALDGDPAAFLAMVEADAAAYVGLEGAQLIADDGRTVTDRLWMLAVEFAAAGAHDRAVDLLSAAIGGGSLYIPETMPYGAYEFTPEVRANPRYQALWRSDPRLVELLEIRRQSVESRQMDGVTPEGRRVRPRTE